MLGFTKEFTHHNILHADCKQNNKLRGILRITNIHTR